VEAVLAQGENQVTLTQIEDLVLSARSQMEQELTNGLLEQQVSRTRSDLPTGPDCRQPMQPKGKKKRDLRTRSGEGTATPLLLLPAGSWHFPDEQLGLHDHSLSPLLARHAVWLSSCCPAKPNRS
jgi:hypothetical protein